MNDWHTAIVPNWLKTLYMDKPFFQNIASVYTIHNLSYFGSFGQRILEIAGLAQFGFIVHPDCRKRSEQRVRILWRAGFCLRMPSIR